MWLSAGMCHFLVLETHWAIVGHGLALHPSSRGCISINDQLELKTLFGRLLSKLVCACVRVYVCVCVAYFRREHLTYVLHLDQSNNAWYSFWMSICVKLAVWLDKFLVDFDSRANAEYMECLKEAWILHLDPHVRYLEFIMSVHFKYSSWIFIMAMHDESRRSHTDMEWTGSLECIICQTSQGIPEKNSTFFRSRASRHLSSSASPSFLWYFMHFIR